MTIRRIAIADLARLNQALLLPATRKDSYRFGDMWHGVGDYETWKYNIAVDGIRQFPKNAFDVGDMVEIYDLSDRLGATMKIEWIKMIDGAEIRGDDLWRLGYRDRDEWTEQTEGGLGQRKAWLLIGPIERHELKGLGAAVGTIHTTNVETGETETSIADLRDHPAQ